ncbi:MAG: NUDIX domain-containing protein [Planctomycetia bacterium]|nr:NUDIX domain-containing protein [Planctomycetia bacterium]
MTALPYQIATLVYIFNREERLLLLHRSKSPNRDLYSPIGGKLEQAVGESPYTCALREIREETGVELELRDLRLCGIVSEQAFEGHIHCLMFCFESLRLVDLPERTIAEGRLEWVKLDEIESKPIPATDRRVIWPLMRRHSAMLNGGPRRAAGRDIFSVHIDCGDPRRMRIVMEYPIDESDIPIAIGTP